LVLILEILNSPYFNEPNFESSQFVFVIHSYAINEVKFCSHDFLRGKHDDEICDLVS